MQYQYHINENESAKWPRCKHVEVTGDQVICELDWEHAYLLAGAHIHKPHLDFLNLQNDQDLVRFLRQWGPLFAAEPELNKPQCWSYYRKLRAIGELVEAFKDGSASCLRNALLELIAAEREYDSHLFGSPGIPAGNLPILALSLNVAFRPGPEQPQDWIPQLNIRRLREVGAWVMGAELSVRSKLNAAWRDGSAKIDWQPDVVTLAEVMKWCVWHSVVGRLSLAFCKNCRDSFYPDSAHERKFCSDLCAKRWTAREWARKNRRKQKLDLRRGKHAKTKEA